jgi:hypothetical protein
MILSVIRLAVLTATLFGVINVSVAPGETPELETRDPAKAITKCTKAKPVALTYEDNFYFGILLD